MTTILITGGTGLIGKSVTEFFRKEGFIVHILTRHPEEYKNTSQVSYFGWNTEKQTFDKASLKNVEVIINLAGENIAEKKWSKNRKIQIAKSRVQAGELITKILLFEKHQVKTLIQASATGWYNANEHFTTQFQEEQPAAEDFLGKTCLEWENSIADLHNNQIRIIIARLGIIVNKDGGMVAALKKPLQMGIKTILGSGNQIVPWIHYQDVNRMFLFFIKNTETQGIYNVVASYTTSQKELIAQLAILLRMKTWLTIRIPAFILKLFLGELSIELLKSSVIRNDKIKKAGFQFEYPALTDIKSL